MALASAFISHVCPLGDGFELGVLYERLHHVEVHLADGRLIICVSMVSHVCVAYGRFSISHDSPIVTS